jgi:hypothetical protein
MNLNLKNWKKLNSKKKLEKAEKETEDNNASKPQSFTFLNFEYCLWIFGVVKAEVINLLCCNTLSLVSFEEILWGPLISLKGRYDGP